MFNSQTNTWTIPQSDEADRYLTRPGLYGLKVLRGPSQPPTVDLLTNDPDDPYMGQMCPRCHTVCYGDCIS